MASADGNSNEIAIGFGAVGNGTNSVTLGNTDIATTVLRGNVHFADGAAPYTSYIGIKSPNSPTTYNLILPPAQGGSDTYLKNDGAGNLSWAIAGSGLYWSLAGNGGTDSTINFIGTTDNNALMFKITKHRVK
jgi:hypothetical protein